MRKLFQVFFMSVKTFNVKFNVSPIPGIENDWTVTLVHIFEVSNRISGMKGFVKTASER